MNNDFIRVSKEIGSNLDYIQGAGGNTSYKEGDTLYVKASGKWLKDSDQPDTFVTLSRKKVLEALASSKEDLSDCYLEQSSLKPSIEAVFHALLPKKVIFHTHSVNAIAWAVQKEGESKLKAILSGYRWLWIPYAKPGVPVTKNIEKSEYHNADILILQNHGIIYCGEDTESISRLIETIEQKLLHALTLRGAETNDFLATDPFALSICKKGRIYPDEVVFLGTSPLIIQNESDAQQDTSAKYIIIENDKVLLSKNAQSTIEVMLHCHREVLRRIPAGTELRFLTDSELHELVHWDAEKYRQSLISR